MGICLAPVIESETLRQTYWLRMPHAWQTKLNITFWNAIANFQGYWHDVLIMRYHSIVDQMPEGCDSYHNWWSRNHIIQHKELPICGLQYHPESIGSPDGLKMVENFRENCCRLVTVFWLNWSTSQNISSCIENFEPFLKGKRIWKKYSYKSQNRRSVSRLSPSSLWPHSQNEVPESQIAAYGAKTKGETADEIAGIVRASRDGLALTFTDAMWVTVEIRDQSYGLNINNGLLCL